MTETPPSHPPLCKICGTPSVFFDRCDFHNNASLHRGFYSLPLDPSGVLLDYHQCPLCGFLFTDFMDKWNGADFSHYVYNKEYPLIDGSFNGYRAGALANTLYLGFSDQLKTLDFLDYGGGTGIQAALLRAFGARRAETYDPFGAGERPQGTFHVVTSLEMLEHSLSPKETIADWLRFTSEDSLVFFTTETQPESIQVQKCKWHYINPRVGHVSLHNKETLRRLFAPHGFELFHITPAMHVAFRCYPLWASGFIPEQLLRR